MFPDSLAIALITADCNDIPSLDALFEMIFPREENAGAFPANRKLLRPIGETVSAHAAGV
ncbi:hypothetical protein ACVBGC_26295 [Burkholderia stagnalis]